LSALGVERLSNARKGRIPTLTPTLALSLTLLVATCNTGPAISLGMKCSAQQATSLGIQGTCQEELEELREKTDRAIVVQTIEVLATVSVNVTGEVQEGSFAVSLKDEKAIAVSATAAPDQPLKLTLTTRLDALNQIAFTLIPADSGAKGVKYEVQFDCHCLP